MARDFNGTTDKIDCGSATVLDDLDSSALTFCAWINPDTVGELGFGQIFNKGGVSGSEYFFQCRSGNFLQFRVDYTTTDLIVSTANSAFTLDVWQHVAISWDGGVTAANAEVFVNGVEVGYQTQQNASGTRVSTAGGSLWLGNRAAADLTFDGAIAFAGIWNVKLTPEEIRFAMSAHRPRRDANVGYWRLDGLDSPEPDSSGRGNHGILTGTTKVDGPPMLSFYSKGRKLQHIFPSGTLHEKVLNESATATDSMTLIKAAVILMTEAVTAVDSIIKTAFKNILMLEGVTILEVPFVKETVKLLTEAATATENVAKSIGRTFSEAVSAIDAATVTKVTAIILTEAVTAVDSVVKGTTRVLSEAATAVDATLKSLTRTLSESVTATDVVTALKTVITIVMNEAATATDSVVKATTKVLSEAATAVDQTVRGLTRTLAESVAASDIVTSVKAAVITMIETVQAIDSASVVKAVHIILNEIATATDLLVRGITKVFSESVQAIDSVVTSGGSVVAPIASWVKRFILRSPKKKDHDIGI